MFIGYQLNKIKQFGMSDNQKANHESSNTNEYTNTSINSEDNIQILKHVQSSSKVTDTHTGIKGNNLQGHNNATSNNYLYVRSDSGSFCGSSSSYKLYKGNYWHKGAHGQRPLTHKGRGMYYPPSLCNNYKCYLKRNTQNDSTLKNDMYINRFCKCETSTCSQKVFTNKLNTKSHCHCTFYNLSETKVKGNCHCTLFKRRDFANNAVKSSSLKRNPSAVYFDKQYPAKTRLTNNCHCTRYKRKLKNSFVESRPLSCNCQPSDIYYKDSEYVYDTKPFRKLGAEEFKQGFYENTKLSCQSNKRKRSNIVLHNHFTTEFKKPPIYNLDHVTNNNATCIKSEELYSDLELNKHKSTQNVLFSNKKLVTKRSIKFPRHSKKYKTSERIVKAKKNTKNSNGKENKLKESSTTIIENNVPRYTTVNVLAYACYNVLKNENLIQLNSNNNELDVHPQEGDISEHSLISFTSGDCTYENIPCLNSSCDRKRDDVEIEKLYQTEIVEIERCKNNEVQRNEYFQNVVTADTKEFTKQICKLGHQTPNVHDRGNCGEVNMNTLANSRVRTNRVCKVTEEQFQRYSTKNAVDPSNDLQQRNSIEILYKTKKPWMTTNNNSCESLI